jgi:V/A-type H+/Na+-transporting ATPase subunit D
LAAGYGLSGKIMAKVSLTKNELKKQKDSLKRFARYLPMLLLKKKQLQLEITKVHRDIKETADEFDGLRAEVIVWADVFAQNLDLSRYVFVEKILTKPGNVAGVDVPVFDGVNFKEEKYDLMLTPWWVDSGVEAIKKAAVLKARLAILHRQVEALKEELRITTQRVNLFEKIKIPKAQENIRVIQIYLGELQTAEVVRGKIAKAKLERKKVLAYDS